jgi:hypothetical protein
MAAPVGRVLDWLIDSSSLAFRAWAHDRRGRRELKTGSRPAGFFPSRVLYPPHSRPRGGRKKAAKLSGAATAGKVFSAPTELVRLVGVQVKNSGKRDRRVRWRRLAVFGRCVEVAAITARTVANPRRACGGRHEAKESLDTARVFEIGVAPRVGLLALRTEHPVDGANVARRSVRREPDRDGAAIAGRRHQPQEVHLLFAYSPTALFHFAPVKPAHHRLDTTALSRDSVCRSPASAYW